MAAGGAPSKMTRYQVQADPACLRLFVSLWVCLVVSLCRVGVCGRVSLGLWSLLMLRKVFGLVGMGFESLSMLATN